MYESEYRLALRNAGFDKFRVLLFQQSGGLNQAEAEAGLEMNVDFFLAILNALNIGDIINDVAYQIRPYEINAGETDRVLEESMEILHDVLRRRQPWLLHGKTGDLLKKTNFAGTAEFIGKFVNQLFAAIPIDRTRVKPIVKITGEFWAQTTEGDGNFNMFRFLEKEGAQVVVEPIGTWICYLMHQVVQQARDEKGLKEGATLPPTWRLDKRLKINLRMQKKIAQIKAAEFIFTREYNRIIAALGGTAHHLVDQYELQRLGHPYYNSRAAGGEGHLEVAKNIYYSNKGLAHMVLALKPFGCMPSTQSDGAQSAVMSHYKDMIFLPVETSGEGDVNAHSRVQMALGEAKAKTKLEFKASLDSTGRTMEEIRAYVDEHPELKSPLYKVPKTDGVIGLAANFVRHVAGRMKADGIPAQASSSSVAA
jgi:predicted nucleotide-binding protein (sugar kinase/HSP70/actin superfamily)